MSLFFLSLRYFSKMHDHKNVSTTPPMTPKNKNSAPHKLLTPLPTLIKHLLKDGSDQNLRLLQRQLKEKHMGSDLVEVEIKGDFAIAFGDVIVGKIDPNIENPAKGFLQPPPPHAWPSHEIPFQISNDLPHPERVQIAIDYFHAHTPIRFIPFDGDSDAIVFEPGEEHCYSYLGKIGGVQPIRLADECGAQEILHEMMHALGFIHEHSRTDRDAYIEINWDNINEQYDLQFEKVPEIYMSTVEGTLFDFRSIMIYKPNFFALDKSQPTLRAKGHEKINPIVEGLSPLDIERINRIYGM